MIASSVSGGTQMRTGGRGCISIKEGEVAYKNEEAKGVVKGTGALFSLDCRNDGETAWGESNGECDPEASVRGQSSSAKSIPHSHLPRKHAIQQQQQQKQPRSSPQLISLQYLFLVCQKKRANKERKKKKEIGKRMKRKRLVLKNNKK